MGALKSYTDFEQSKRLAEILPIESADMFYTSFNRDYPWIWIDKHLMEVDDIPCWSLLALLGVLPEPELIQNQEGTWLLRIWDNKRFPWSVGGYINPVDACVEMIVKLKENNLL